MVWIWDTLSVYEQQRASWPFLQGQLCDLFTYNVCGSRSNTTCSGRTLRCPLGWTPAWGPCVTHTHRHRHSVPVISGWHTLWPNMRAVLIQSYETTRDQLGNPLFIPRACRQHVSEMQIYLCLSFWVMDSTLSDSQWTIVSSKGMIQN